jgi:hypothetical protein
MTPVFLFFSKRMLWYFLGRGRLIPLTAGFAAQQYLFFLFFQFQPDTLGKAFY